MTTPSRSGTGMADALRVVPTRDGESREYWEGIDRGELLFKRCRGCGSAHWYPRAHCPRCHADATEWERASGHGYLYTFTTVRQNTSPAFADWVPYSIGLVDLDEGPRVFAHIDGAKGDMRIGADVMARFRPIADGAVLPIFDLVPAREEL